jgi:exonuclease V
MQTEFPLAIPHGVGRLLRAEYRSRDDGNVIGSHVFGMDDGVLDVYVRGGIGWWRGERAPRVYVEGWSG